MSDKLADTFGEDFAESYQKKLQQKRQSRNRLSDEDKALVADKAVNEGAIQEGDPMFDYTDQSGVVHRVMLMEFPDMENGTVYSYANELDTGAVSIPFSFLGDWVSCLFNEGKEAVADFAEGDMYLVVGQHGTWENDSGEENDQLSPVTAVMTLEEVNELADESMDQEGFGSEPDEVTEEPEVEETVEEADDEDEEEEDASDDGGDLFDEEDDEEDEPEDTSSDYGPIDPDEIKEKVEALAGKDERVWDAERDSAWSEKIAATICNSTDYEDQDDVEEVAMTYIVDGEDAMYDLFGSGEEEAEDDDDDDDEELLFG